MSGFDELDRLEALEACQNTRDFIDDMIIEQVVKDKSTPWAVFLAQIRSYVEAPLEHREMASSVDSSWYPEIYDWFQSVSVLYSMVLGSLYPEELKQIHAISSRYAEDEKNESSQYKRSVLFNIAVSKILDMMLHGPIKRIGPQNSKEAEAVLYWMHDIQDRLEHIDMLQRTMDLILPKDICDSQKTHPQGCCQYHDLKKQIDVSKEFMADNWRPETFELYADPESESNVLTAEFESGARYPIPLWSSDDWAAKYQDISASDPPTAAHILGILDSNAHYSTQSRVDLLDSILMNGSPGWPQGIIKEQFEY